MLGTVESTDEKANKVFALMDLTVCRGQKKLNTL